MINNIGRLLFGQVAELDYLVLPGDMENIDFLLKYQILMWGFNTLLSYPKISFQCYVGGWFK